MPKKKIGPQLRVEQNDAKSYPLLPGLRRYLSEFECGKANPHGIKVRFKFSDGSVRDEPFNLTPTGSLRPEDRKFVEGLLP